MSDITQQDVDDALREVDDLVDGIGEQVIETVTDQVDGQNLKGRRIQHGDHVYVALGSPSFRHLKLQASFNAVEALAVTKAQTGGGPRVQNGQLTQTALQEAQRDIHQHADVDEFGHIRTELIKRLNQGEQSILLDVDGSFVQGFTVEDRLFIYDKNIHVDEFYDEVQVLINKMWAGKEYLVSAYDLRNIDTNGGGTPRGFA